VIVLILPLLALWWWRAVGLRETARLSLISGMALVPVITPWTIRNIRVHMNSCWSALTAGASAPGQ